MTVPDYAAAVAATFVAVVVTGYTDEGEPRYRRHPVMSLAAAQRRVNKAREAGHDAEIVVCELMPVAVMPRIPDVGAA